MARDAAMTPFMSLQYVRALAALAVVAFHALQWGDGGFDVGRAGVDVFFVVSGFVLWRSAGGGALAPGAFLWRRWTRVAPLYILMTLATATLAAAWPEFLPNVHPEAGHVLLSLLFIPHFDPRGLPFPLLPQGWTLCYEALFYLLFAAALLTPRRRRAAALCAGLIALVSAGFLLRNPAYILGANPLMLEFGLGVVLARWDEHGALPGRAGGALLLALGLLALAVPAGLGLFSEMWRPLLWGAPAGLIVAGAVALERSCTPRRLSGLARIGDASYSIYLVHLPVTAVAAHTLGAHPASLLAILALLASTAVGLACHIGLERPLIAAFRRRRLSQTVEWQPGCGRSACTPPRK
jgi:exopolysaccharide production protein ExoZ